MSTLKFKTTINCDGCKAKVSKVLDNASGIVKWQVDTMNPLKILTVDTDALSAEEVIKVVNSAGFKAEII